MIFIYLLFLSFLSAFSANQEYSIREHAQQVLNELKNDQLILERLRGSKYFRRYAYAYTRITQQTALLEKLLQDNTIDVLIEPPIFRITILQAIIDKIDSQEWHLYPSLQPLITEIIHAGQRTPHLSEYTQLCVRTLGDSIPFLQEVNATLVNMPSMPEPLIELKEKVQEELDTRTLKPTL